MENLTESQIKRKIDTLKQALEDKNVPEVAHPKMKEDLKKFEKMLKDFEKKVEKEAEKDIKKVDDIADLDLPELDLDEDTTTTPKKKRGRPKGSTNKKRKATKKTKEYTLTVDGKKFTFKDKASKDVCSKAVEYAKAKKEQQATASKKYASKSVGAKISNNLQTIARQAVSKAKQRKVAPAVLKKQVDAVEKAFNSLFSALQTLTGVTISQAQKNAIMRILTDFEKTQTTSTTKSTQVKKKEMGGTVDNWEDVDPDVLYGKGGAISVGEKVRINDSGEVMTVKDISKNSKNQVEFSGSKGTFLIGDIEKMEKGGGIPFSEIPRPISEDEIIWVANKSKYKWEKVNGVWTPIMSDSERKEHLKSVTRGRYADGGEVQEPKNSWDWQSFL